MNLLGRYVALHFFKAAGAVMLLLLALFSFLSLSEALEDVGHGAFTTSDAVSVVLLTMPTRLIELLPVTTLLGSVIGLGLLANHSELTAMRAAGLSAARLSRLFVAIAVVVIAGAALLQFLVIPIAEREAQAFRSRTLEQTALGGTEFWSRHDRRVIRVGAVAFGRIPQDIEIYELGPHDHLTRLLRARRADVVSAGEWLLHDVDERVLDADTVYHRHLDQLSWKSFLSPEQVSTLIAPAHALSPIDLYRYLQETRGSGVDRLEHQSRFWRQVSLPLTVLGMMLLGLPIILGSIRVRSTAFRAVVGAVIGIGFYLFQQIAAQLTFILDLDPAATALSPAALVLLCAVLGIRRMA